MQPKQYANVYGLRVVTKNYPNSIVAAKGPSHALGITASTVLKGDKSNPLPHSYTVTDVRFPKGKNLYTSTYLSGPDKGKTIMESHEGCVAFNATHPFSDGVSYPSYLYNQCLSKLNEKVRGSLDLSVSLAEAGQTARILRVTDTIREFFTEYHGWRGLVKGISDARLAFALGWRPLAGDLYGSLDESLRIVLNEIESFKARSTENVESSSGKFTFHNFGDVHAPVRRTGKYTCELGIKLRTGGMNYDRWTSLNPVSIAWELVPGSFVLDWIIDVGSYIRDVETSLLYNNSFVNGYKTQGIFFDGSWSCNASRSQNYGTLEQFLVQASASFRYRKLTRTLLSSYPAARLPSFNAELSSGRLFTLAALFGSKLKGKSFWDPRVNNGKGARWLNIKPS